MSQTVVVFQRFLLELQSLLPITFGERCVREEPRHCRLGLRLEQTHEYHIGTLQTNLRLLEEFGRLPAYVIICSKGQATAAIGSANEQPESGAHPGMSWLKLMVMLAVDSPSAFLATTRYSPPSSGFTSANSRESVHSYETPPFAWKQVSWRWI